MNNKQTKNTLLAVIATGIMAFSGVIIETAMNVTFPTLMKEFSISTNTVQWVTTIYLLMIAITVPISGFLIKKFSAKHLFLTANLLFLVGVILDFLSPSFFILLSGRILQGAATGIALPLMFHLILTEAPLEKRGLMMGIGTLTTAIAPAIGPTYGGFLTTHLSWHEIFLFLIPLLLISLGLGLSNLVYQKQTAEDSFDFLNFIFLALSFTGFMACFGFLGEITGFLLLALGLISGFLFFKRNKEKQQPLLNFSLFKEPYFGKLLFSFLVYQFILLGVSFILPNFIQITLGKSSAIAGLAMLPGALIGAVLAPIGGRILDRRGPKKPLLFGTLLALIGFFLLTFFIYLKAPVPFLILGHVTFQIGSGISYSNFITTAMNQLPKKLYNDGNSLFNTLQQFTGGIATSIVASIIALFQHQKGSLPLTTQQGSVAAGSLLVLLLLFSFISIFSLQKKPLK